MKEKIHTVPLLIALTVGSAGVTARQHQDHEMPVQQAASSTQMDVERATACVQSQRQALDMAAQISRRLETAQRNDSPADMRGTISDVQAALSQLRTTLRTCAVPANTSMAGIASPKPTADMDHAAMGHAVQTAKPVELDPQLVSTCVQSQEEAARVAERQSLGLELARQTNGVADMRTAMSELHVALPEFRASVQKCEPLRVAVAAAETAASAEAMDHSKMAMGGAAPAAGAGAKPAAPMDHSKMAMGGTPPADAKSTKPTAPMDHSKMAMPGATAAKPGTAAGAKPAAPMDHSKMAMPGTTAAAKPGTAAGAKPAAPIDHSKMAMPGAPAATGSADTPMKMETAKLPVVPAQRIPDPACPNNVTQPNAPKAAYQRKVYYFCSTADRDQFRKDPAGYLKRRPR